MAIIAAHEPTSNVSPIPVPIFSSEILSALNPFLLQLEIASAVLVGIGIVFESERFPNEVHRTAFWFVLIGIVLETVFSIMLFASEEQISQLQRGTIATLVNTALPRELEEKLSAETLKRFSSVEVLIRSDNDPEARRTAGQIRYMLIQEAGWKSFQDPLRELPVFFDGVVIHTGPLGANDEVATALADILLKNDIDARVGFPLPQLGSKGMLIPVGLRPLPAILQNELAKRLKPKGTYGKTLEFGP
jgi:hypothetical protein